MKKWLAFTLILALWNSALLIAEEPDLDDKLRAIMTLFDKNQTNLKRQIEELKQTNMVLTKANLDLSLKLNAVREEGLDLGNENMILRSKISEVAVKELESAALPQPLLSPVEIFGPNLTAPVPANRNQVDRPLPNGPASADRPITWQQRDLININTATAEELATLSVIDMRMAELIISNRPYETVEDLVINRGFGALKLNRIIELITAE